MDKELGTAVASIINLMQSDEELPKVKSVASEIKKARDRRLERYNMMRNFRNELRTVFEKSAILSGLIDEDSVSEMSLAEIFDEDVSFHARMMMPLDQKAQLEYLAQNDPLQITRETMERNQKARYIGAKMNRLIQEKKYLGARLLYEEARDKTTKGLDVKAIDDVCKLYVLDAIGVFFENGDYHKIFNLIKEFGKIMELSKKDFAELDFFQDTVLAKLEKEDSEEDVEETIWVADKP